MIAANQQQKIDALRSEAIGKANALTGLTRTIVEEANSQVATAALAGNLADKLRYRLINQGSYEVLKQLEEIQSQLLMLNRL